MIVWEKLIVWIIVAVVIFVVIYFLAAQLGDGGIMGTFFNASKETSTITTLG